MASSPPSSQQYAEWGDRVGGWYRRQSRRTQGCVGCLAILTMCTCASVAISIPLEALDRLGVIELNTPTPLPTATRTPTATPEPTSTRPPSATPNATETGAALATLAARPTATTRPSSTPNPTTTPVPEPPAAEPSALVTLHCPDCVDIGMSINLWDVPGGLAAGAYVVGSHPHGTTCTQLDRAGEFLKVRCLGDVGWVKDSLVR